VRDLFDQLARVTRSLSSPRRLELVDLLAQRERSVNELAQLTSMSVANTSRHLQALRSARLVSVRRSGLHAYYSLADEGVFRVWQAVRDLGENRLASVREMVRFRFEGSEHSGPVAMDELHARVRAGTAVLVDARPEEEFVAGHVPGAVNLPPGELEASIHVLPMDQEVIAYSRGPYCGFAEEIVAALRARGMRARRFALGFPDWRAAGLPVETG